VAEEGLIVRWLTANLSYSSRIDWPNIALLDPRLRFQDPTTARAGNPSLRPEKTHSLELRLVAKAGRHEADLTSHYQRTRDLRTDLVELEGDVLVSRPVNLGTRKSLGMSLAVRGPLARGLRYTVTGDLGRETFDTAGFPGADDAATRHGASLQLDYRDGIEGRAGADQIRLAARYTGPTETGLSGISTIVRAEASWSHALTGRLSAVLTASHVLKPPRFTSFGPEVVSRTIGRASGPTINFALTCALSSSGR
jgi:ferric enterobactin receptor